MPSGSISRPQKIVIQANVPPANNERTKTERRRLAPNTLNTPTFERSTPPDNSMRAPIDKGMTEKSKLDEK